ncbi:MAG: cache domain-containing protein, partial [Gemmatimonadota bacterium]|nr:cache domain-containing protein [Gemmatimonadota bacterium]
MAVSRRVLTKVRELGRQRGGRLSRRLLVWFLLFSLVPLLITNAVGYQRSKTILEQLVDRYLSAVTRVQVQHVRDRIDHHLLLLQAIVTGNQFLAAGALRYQGRPAGQMGAVASLDAVREFLVRKQREISSFDAIDLYTTDGRVIASAGDSSLDVRTPLPDWAQGGALWTALRRGAHGPEPVFQLAVPLTSAGDPRPVAYLGATVSLASEGAFLEVPAHVAGRVE